MDRIKVGKIVSAVGIKGEVKVYPYTDYPERFEELEGVYADGEWLEIDRVRYQKNMAVIKFTGTDRSKRCGGSERPIPYDR